MRYFIVAIGIAVIAGLSAVPAAAQPRGSYRASCRDIREHGPFLTAECRARNGRWVRSRLDLRDCGRAGIANINGRLTCERRPVYPPHRDDYRDRYRDRDHYGDRHRGEGQRYYPPNPRWHTPNGCPPQFTVQDGLCKPYTGR